MTGMNTTRIRNLAMFLVLFSGVTMAERTIESVVADIGARRAEELDALFGPSHTIAAITFIGIKEDAMLEVWIRRNGNKDNIYIKSYPFTAICGHQGPKLLQGDMQIPEGIYRIDHLNPNSSYYLSMKVDYPNAFDRVQATSDRRSNLGGDIFIHGKDVTIGCIPIGDEAIEELFYLVAKAGKNKVTVLLSPVDFRLKRIPSPRGMVSWYPQLCDLIKKKLLEYKKR